MQTQKIQEQNIATIPIIEFLDMPARMTGLIREIYIARGWIRDTGHNEHHYELTPLGERMLQTDNQ